MEWRHPVGPESEFENAILQAIARMEVLERLVIHSIITQLLGEDEPLAVFQVIKEQLIAPQPVDDARGIDPAIVGLFSGFQEDAMADIVQKIEGGLKIALGHR